MADRQLTPVGLGASQAMHRLGKRECNQSRAKQHKPHNGHSEETFRSELLTHGAPPNCVTRALLEGNDCPIAQSKGFPSDVQFRSRLMFRYNTCSEMSGSYEFHSNRALVSAAFGGCSFLKDGRAEIHSAVRRRCSTLRLAASSGVMVL